ncbi:hypothetical protein QBC39DRAFT_337430 [Podospora conica]|nr:hypothetical protein QBC39DRAFT_337430 [Schizothecium conicum]
MDLLQTVRRAAATSSAVPSLLALSLRAPLSTTRRLLSDDQPPRPPPATYQSESLARLRNQIKRTSDDSLFGGRSATRGTQPLTSMQHLKDLIQQDASQLSSFDEDDFYKKNIHRTAQASLRLRPVTGRTVNVTNGDVSWAFNNLQRRVQANKVKQDKMRQRFHERPALKRKRKLRERWRARFKEGVNAAIKRTMTLRAQGW